MYIHINRQFFLWQKIHLNQITSAGQMLKINGQEFISNVSYNRGGGCNIML